MRHFSQKVVTKCSVKGRCERISVAAEEKSLDFNIL